MKRSESALTWEKGIARLFDNPCNKMRNFAGLLKPVVRTIKQVASNIHVHAMSFTNLNFIVVFFKLLSAVDQ